MKFDTFSVNFDFKIPVFYVSNYIFYKSTYKIYLHTTPSNFFFNFQHILKNIHSFYIAVNLLTNERGPFNE